MPAASPIVVLGAGPAGIGAGLALGDGGLVLERAARPGGLSRSFELDGAVFDLGGHSFHTPHPEVRELAFQALDLYTQPRQARCYTHGVLIPYPFQVHFREIPDSAVVAECEAGLQATGKWEHASDFEEYVCRRFGAGIARHFLLPYNRKLWGDDLTRLAVDWTAERIAAPVGVSEQFAESGRRRTPLREDTQIAYPASGGFEALMIALARRLPQLRLNERVVRVDPARHELATATGETIRWRRLISTLPIPALLEILTDVPARIVDLAASLEALPLALVCVVIGHPVDTPIQRIYCAGPDVPAHKIVVSHNSSPCLRARTHHGILAEVALAPGRAWCDGDLIRQVVSGLVTLGLIRSSAEVRLARILRVPRAYPVPTRQRDAVMRELRMWLEDRGIYCVGRFAEWAYINSDEALFRGLTLGRRLIGAGIPRRISA
jgi:UDP-galactopyranose mutase